MCSGFGFWADFSAPDALLGGSWGRDYLLYRGPKEPIVTWPDMLTDPGPVPWSQSANLIWPDDRAWCIATEIDWDSTLIAASGDVAQAILADRRLEAFPVGYDDDLSWCGDTVNPRPEWLADQRGQRAR